MCVCATLARYGIFTPRLLPHSISITLEPGRSFSRPRCSVSGNNTRRSGARRGAFCTARAPVLRTRDPARTQRTRENAEKGGGDATDKRPAARSRAISRAGTACVWPIVHSGVSMVRPREYVCVWLSLRRMRYRASGSGVGRRAATFDLSGPSALRPTAQAWTRRHDARFTPCVQDRVLVLTNVVGRSGRLRGKTGVAGQTWTSARLRKPEGRGNIASVCCFWRRSPAL